LKKPYKKYNFPVGDIRRYLEPGPIVLVTSSHKGKDNIMTMGWYTLMEFNPSLIGCMIVGYNHSHELIRKSGECVINLPTVDLLRKIIGIGNCHGNSVDKFEQFSLTASPATYVKAHVPKTPKYPKTIHYTGDGVFMFSGRHAGYRKKFRRENL
jgi:hypothetical protein